MTTQGEATFLGMMREIASPTEISDPHKFTLRLIFFRYLAPDARQELLNRRLEFLQENRKSLAEMAQVPSSGLDRFRRALITYHAKLNAEESAFIEALVAAEQSHVPVQL